MSWFILKGTQPVYRQATQTPLTVSITVPKTQSPSDLVTVGVSVKGALANSTSFVNLIVTDEFSNQNLTNQDAQSNIQGRLIENEFLALGIPVYDYTVLTTSVVSSAPALDALTASQLLRNFYSNI